MVALEKMPFYYHLISWAKENNINIYLVGGYIRDFLIKGESKKDIDFAVEGDVLAFSETFCSKIKEHIVGFVKFPKFSTVKIKVKYNEEEWELNFTSTRKELYNETSRKPEVSFATIDEDLKRRDFTINAIAISLIPPEQSKIYDPFNGIQDITKGIIKTPQEPRKTFYEDPLRILRAFRFASELNFTIEADTFNAILETKERLKIVSMERITDEINKILLSPNPSKGFLLMDKTSVLSMYLPEITALKGVSEIEGKTHKDVFLHTMQVLDNIAKEDKARNLWLRWAALLHDIGKPLTKKFDPEEGWTFREHDVVGSKMIYKIFKRLKLPLDHRMKYVKKIVYLHQRPSLLLTSGGGGPHGYRKFFYEAGEHLNDIFILALSDITSKNASKVLTIKNNLLKLKDTILKQIEQDKIKNWQPPIRGNEIMEILGVPPSPIVGTIKQSIKEAILQEIIPDDKEIALQFAYEKIKALGLTPVIPYEVAYEKFVKPYKNPINQRTEQQN